ncbi:MAG: hypothetical protein EPO52_06500 [Herbiconiux sp.]|uniref:hypothetical protein n=1 Tax=Herbiconiux sp. TaxID=1871186 RepID=UPI001202A294|nr:hypothetical protein [Herbiconiux sp.]TAJ47848.1 MAG: hypothetical protein EPO52_06500 [Herbiconiux sp.]
MTSRWARVARGGLVASIAVFLAAFSHVAAGGSAPGVAGTAIAIAFALLASIAVTGKRLTLPRIAVAVTVSQFFFHLVFSLGGASSMTMTQNGHHGAVIVEGAADPMASMDHSGGWMWVAHAVAAVVTIVFLWRGERGLWRVLSTATRHLATVLIDHLVFVPVASRGVAVRVPTVSRTVFRDDLGVVLSSLRHRGPPASILSF